MKEPSERRLDAEHVEVIAGREIAPRPDGGAAPLEIDRRDAVADETIERRRAVAEVAVVGERLGRMRALILHEEHAFGLRNRQRLQHERVDDAEDDGVRADAKRQREDRHERECRRARERADGIPHVGAQIVEEPEAARLPALILVRFDTAEFQPRA